MTSSAAIVGIHEHPRRVVGPGVSELQLMAASAGAALADAGLGWADVDALFTVAEHSLSGLTLPEYLRLDPRIVDTTAVGGSSFELHVDHAVRAIAAGKASVALLAYGSTARSSALNIGTGGIGFGAVDPASNMESVWGATLISNYAMAASRHMHEYGTTSAQLAEIAVATRAHAVRNPDAVRAMTDLGFQGVGEITVDDVLASPLISDPLHRLDCCMVSDGAGAVVLASPAVARSVRTSPVWILGAAEAVSYPGNREDVTTSAAARSGPAAFGEAGVRPDEVDVAMIYDSFTITVLTILEDLGFCGKGEGGAFVEGGRLRWDSADKPALNTDGGGLSSNQPGMRGIFLLIEAARQLRGESTSQVPGARLAVASGNGGFLANRHAAGTVVLGKD